MELPLSSSLVHRAFRGNLGDVGFLHINHDVDDIRALNSLLSETAVDLRFVPIDYQTDTQPTYRSEILSAVEQLSSNGRKYVVVEDGGHFSRLLLEEGLAIDPPLLHVEQTTSGEHWAMLRSQNGTASPFPTISIARSYPKTRIENHFVAERVLEETSLILLMRGETLYHRTCLVVGYGILGRSVAHKLRARGCSVSVIERKESIRATAKREGFSAVPEGSLPDGKIELIFGVTGGSSLTVNDIRLLARAVPMLYLISCSSGSGEFSFLATDVSSEVTIVTKDSEFGELYEFKSGEAFALVASGRPVNFFRRGGESLPACMADLIDGQLILATAAALERRATLGGSFQRLDRTLLLNQGFDGYHLAQTWADLHLLDLSRVLRGGYPAIGVHPNEDELLELPSASPASWA